jgi:hypothetical protein
MCNKTPEYNRDQLQLFRKIGGNNNAAVGWKKRDCKSLTVDGNTVPLERLQPNYWRSKN